MSNFQDMTIRTIADRSGFCFGCDPSLAILRDWNLSITAAGLHDFVSIVLEAIEGTAGFVKPQAAFYEAFGVEGLTEMRRLTLGAQERGALVIGDVKRGDIGTSIEAYGRGWLGRDAPFGVDAMTATSYLGLNALKPLFNRAKQTGAGVFVVIRSSNVEGQSVQSALMDGEAVADRLADGITELNRELAPGSPIGPLGAVVGATLGRHAVPTIRRLPNALFLVPGLGAQGATADDIVAMFGDSMSKVILSASRSVLAAGPHVNDLRRAIQKNVDDVKRASAISRLRTC